MKKPVIKGDRDNDADDPVVLEPNAPPLDPGTRGFFDRTCRSCKKRYGWSGRVSDVPPNCPKCGVALTEREKEALASDEAQIEAFRKQLLDMKDPDV